MPAAPSTRLGLIGPLGGEDLRLGDDIIRAIIATLDPETVIFDQGALSGRPVSTSGSPGKAGRFYKDSATNGVLYYDYGTGWLGVALSERAEFSGVTSIDIPVRSGDWVVGLDFAIETAQLVEVRLCPNADASSIYADVRDGSYLTSDGAAHAVAPSGSFNHNNGLRLAWPAQGSASGGMSVAGRATVALGPSKRTCVSQASVLSLVGSANHAAEVQNTASVWTSATAVTFLRLTLPSGAGTMTGRVRVVAG